MLKKVAYKIIIVVCFLGMMLSCNSTTTVNENDSHLDDINTDSNIDTVSTSDSDTDSDTDSDADTDTDSDTDWREAFAQNEVLQYRIIMDPTDRVHLEEKGNDELYLQASLHIKGGNIDKVFSKVGIRHKGAWTLHSCFESGSRSYEDHCAKLSYKIKFNEYNTSDRFFGLKKINLHAMSGDNTKLVEQLAYDMFNSFGVNAPKTSYAELYINDELIGLFAQVEQVDGRYTAFNFPEDGNGNLYKEVWPKPGYNDSYYLGHLETNDKPEDNPNVSGIQAFAEAIDETSEETFEADMSKWINIDNFLRYMAVDRASNNWDGIVAFYSPAKPHNFYWYHEALPNGIFHLIPWDLDNTFWEFDPFMYPEQWVTADPVPNWNVLPASCEPMPVWEQSSTTRITPPGCDKFLNLLAATNWDRFVTIGEELIKGPLKLSVMEEKLQRWESLIDEAVKRDPNINYQQWLLDAADFRRILERVIRDFEAHLAEGYIIQEPVETIPEPTEEELNKPIPETGLLVEIINNYEFGDKEHSSMLKNVLHNANSTTTASTYWNTDDPLSGNADFMIEFNFGRTPGSWNEWLDVRVSTDDYREYDLNDYEEISLTMRSSTSRTIRISVNSAAYQSEYGGVWPNFMVELPVSNRTNVYKIKLNKLFYPSWAKDEWSSFQGWTVSDEEARKTVLARFNGIIISPLASTDSSGELIEENDDGYLQIDNIYFR